jgi:hypothetical protein
MLQWTDSTCLAYYRLYQNDCKYRVMLVVGRHACTVAVQLCTPALTCCHGAAAADLFLLLVLAILVLLFLLFAGVLLLQWQQLTIAQPGCPLCIA